MSPLDFSRRRNLIFAAGAVPAGLLAAHTSGCSGAPVADRRFMFSSLDEAFQPHFAYGELSKAEYEQAHAIHLANHFSVFRQKA